MHAAEKHIALKGTHTPSYSIRLLVAVESD